MLTAEQIVNDRYVVIGTLGRGGLSIVYEVADLTLPRRWALKQFVPPRLGDDELAQVREQFKREVELLSRLSHPRLPRVVDAFHWNGHDYMVMERIEGETLAARIATATGPFDEGLCQAWALQVLEVLTYLHEQTPPIIFRDIKPENLMVDPAHGIRFIDFGIARLFNPVKEQDTVFMGTPGFAAPEQFRRHQSDPRSDLYSLGATLHSLLTLRDPALNPFAFEPISLVNPKVSKRMEQVVQRALEIRPENRFQSARDMAGVIQGTMDIEQVTMSTNLVVQPRELTFEDLSPRGVHERVVEVHTVGGAPVECTVSCPHDGVEMEPSRFEARRQTVRVRLHNDRFPRGEMVQTSLAFSIPQASVTAPVTVLFRPPFVQSLPAFVIGLVVFLIAAVTSLGACAMAQTASFDDPGLWVAIMLMVAVTLLAASARGVMERPEALGFALAVALALAWPLRWLTDMTSSTLTGGAAAVAWPGIGALFCNAILLRFDMALSARQRQRTRPVLLAGFFGFPVACLLVNMVPGVENPQAAQLVGTLTTSGFGLGVVFLCLFLWYERREEDRILGQDSIGRFATAVGVLFWPLLVTAWLLIDGGLAGAGPRETAGAAWLADRLVLLPSRVAPVETTRLAIFGGVGVLLALGVAMACGQTGGRRPLAALVSLGFGAAVVLAVSALVRASECSDARVSSSLLADVERNPIGVMRLDAVRTRYPQLVEYLTHMNRGVQQRQNGRQATGFFFAAAHALRKMGAVPPALEEQLRLLVNQSALEGGGWTPEMPLPAAPPPLSSLCATGIQWYAGAPNAPRPPAFYTFSMGTDPLRFQTDYEVAAAIQLQRYVVAEIGGREGEAAREMEALRALVGAAPPPASDIFRAVTAEMKLREGGTGTLDEKRLRLGRRYLEQGRLLALPYLQSLGFKGLTLEERLSLLAMESARWERDDPAEIALLRGGVDESVWGPASALAVAYGRKDFARCDELLESRDGPTLLGAGSPYLLRIARDCQLLRGRWGEATATDGLLRHTLETTGRPLTALDDFKSALARDMDGKGREALPFYQAYLEKVGLDAKDNRALLVRARVGGGPLPSLVYVLRSRKGGMTMTIVGQGVPPELMPPILIVFSNVGHLPALRTSDNIRLDRAEGGFVVSKSERVFFNVRFNDLEAERRSGRWRYWITYDFEEFVNWPSALVRQQQDVFCSLFAVAFGAHKPPESVGLFPQRKGDDWFLVASRHRLDPHSTVLPNNMPVFEGYVPDLTPDEIMQMFLTNP